jgi:hypothetical protein
VAEGFPGITFDLESKENQKWHVVKIIHVADTVLLAMVEHVQTNLDVSHASGAGVGCPKNLAVQSARSVSN